MGGKHSVPDKPPPVAQEIKWTGSYWQNDQKNEMHFRNMVLDVSGEVSGAGDDAAGEFT